MSASPVTFRATPQSLYHPSFEDSQKYFNQGDLVPVYRALPADLETPVSVFLKLVQHNETAFLLESVEGGENLARYSFLGVNPAAILRIEGDQLRETRHGQTSHRSIQGDPLTAIQEALGAYKPVVVPGLPRLTGGAVGFLAYDVARHFERLPTTAADELHIPDAQYMIADTVVIFDHVKQQVLVMANAHNTGDTRAAYDDAVRRIEALVERLRAPLPPLPDAPPVPDSTLISNFTQEEFEAAVVKAKEYIAAGDIFQVVPSQRMTRKTSAHPFAIYRSLRMLNPSPYMFYLNFPDDDLHIVGASPEMLVRFEADTRMATVRPIAGTAPRDPDHDKDLANAEHMLNDPKERAEHVMLVDLGRNDLGRVCDFGSVRVANMMYVERFSHVMHITSEVVGKLNQSLNVYDLVRATFPAGTLSGAPKIRAMEIIEELETVRRGLFGGAIGYFSFGGSMDSCIAIRTVVLKGDQLYVQAGAGIVADSDPSKEYQETLNKLRGVIYAIEHAERGL
jgi:anthranilate synthase component I